MARWHEFAGDVSDLAIRDGECPTLDPLTALIAKLEEATFLDGPSFRDVLTRPVARAVVHRLLSRRRRRLARTTGKLSRTRAACQEEKEAGRHATGAARAAHRLWAGAYDLRVGLP